MEAFIGSAEMQTLKFDGLVGWFSQLP